MRSPVCLGDLQSDDAQPFSLSLEEAGTIPIVEGPVCSVCRSGRSLDLEAHGRRDHWPGWHGFHRSPTGQSSWRGNCDYRATTGDGFVVMDYQEQNIFDTLGFDTVDVVLDNLGFPSVR